MRAVDHRLRKLLELRTDTPAMLSALEAVADVHSNKPLAGERARRELRSEIEHRNLAVVHEFIESLRPFEHEVHALEGAVSELKAICRQAEVRVDASQKDTADFLRQAEALSARKRALEGELERTSAFLRQYELSPAEAEALEAGPAGGEAFFAALAHLESIRASSVALVSGRDQALGLELLDHASGLHTRALDAALDWAQARCQEPDALLQVDDLPGDAAAAASAGADALSRSSSSSSSAAAAALAAPRVALQRTLALLRRVRPVYFRACQDAAVAAGRAAFVRRFVRELSGGGAALGAGGAPAASLLASDPLRLLGGVLAWVHLQAAEGREPLQALFGEPPAAAPAEGPAPLSPGGAQAAHSAASPSDEAAAPAAEVQLLSVRDMLTAICDGVSRPLAVRVDQVIAAQSSLVVVCRIVDVLAFYGSVLGGLVHAGTGVLGTLDACRSAAARRFEALLAQQAARFRDPASAAFSADLHASPLVQEAAAQLRELMQVYQEPLAPAHTVDAAAAAPVSSGDAPTPGAAGTAGATTSAAAVLDAVLTPLIDACRNASEGMRLSATACYMLNNLAVLQAALSVYPFTSRWVQRLASEAAVWEESLVQQAANDLLARTGVLAKLAAIRNADAQSTDTSAPLSRMTGLSPDELRVAVTAFYTELRAPQLFAVFDPVAHTKQRARLRRDMAAVLAAAHASLHEALRLPQHAYSVEAIGSVLTLSVSDVDTLLQLI